MSEKMNSDLRHALDTSDFLAVCTQAYSGEQPSLEDIRLAAKNAGLVPEFERDKVVAASANGSMQALNYAGMCIGRWVEVHWNGTVIHNKGRKDNPIPIQVCSPLIVEATGYKADNTRPHLRLRVRTERGSWNEVLLARAELAKGGAWQAILIEAGARIGDPDTLLLLLKTVEPPHLFRVVDHVGWNVELYVLPSGEVIGTKEGADIVPAFQVDAGFGLGGTKEGADEMFRRCADNPRLVLGISAALAAPFLGPLGAEPGGLRRPRTWPRCCGCRRAGGGASGSRGTSAAVITR